MDKHTHTCTWWVAPVPGQSCQHSLLFLIVLYYIPVLKVKNGANILQRLSFSFPCVLCLCLYYFSVTLLYSLDSMLSNIRPEWVTLCYHFCPIWLLKNPYILQQKLL